MKQCMRLSPVLVALVLAFALGACSSDEDGVTGTETTSLAPLSSNYFPLAPGASWSFVRVENGVFSPDTTLDYYDADLPAAYTRWDCEAGTGSDLVLKGSTTSQPDGGGVIEHYLETWLDAAAGGFDLAGEDEGTAVDSSFVYEAGTYAWVRFGELRWEVELASYPNDSLPVDYGGDEQGMRPVNEALGFDFPRTIYDGSSQPGNVPYDPSDVDYDTYLDGVRSVRLVAEIVAEEDFAYASYGTEVDSLFPELADVVYENCRWVRFSLLADLFLSNQRDPNADPGQPAIPEEYIDIRSFDSSARLDIGLLLLAPDIGPVQVVTLKDLDKLVQAGDVEQTQLVFQPDLIQTDILVESSLLP